MFETIDGNLIDVGYFVTLYGEKIRKANANDDYILGVVSATPAMIADASDLRWHNLFVRDEWGRTQYHEVVVPEKRWRWKSNSSLLYKKRTYIKP